METYKQKVERVARAIWYGLASNRPDGSWSLLAESQKTRYRNAAMLALEEEARDVEEGDPSPILAGETRTKETDYPEPEGPKLTLPLTNGQMIVLGDGRVGKVANSNVPGIAAIRDGGRIIQNLFRNTGLCRSGTRASGPEPRGDEAVSDYHPGKKAKAA